MHVLLISILLVSLSWASSSSMQSSSSSYSLEGRIQSAVLKVFPKSRIGLAIRNNHSDLLLHNISAEEWFTPASTLKMVVTAAALDTMPRDWMPSTRVSLEGVIQGRTFVGQIRVIGGGDPNISSRYFPDALTIPRMMADSIKKYGIDTIRGVLVSDPSYFPGPSRPKAWKSYFFDSWYGTEISALSFNDNVYLLKVLPGKIMGDTASVQIFPDVGFVIK
jgi:D-alanyl-D-alanine carboxypeptidase/D-alanyl-D-alanine-endopeptidase (penicillin-binding protein 4)